MEAAGAVDAKNAPTAPWKTGRPVSHSYHRLFLPSLVTGKVSPMFPVNFVTYVPGCSIQRKPDSRNLCERSATMTTLYDRRGPRIADTAELPAHIERRVER